MSTALTNPAITAQADLAQVTFHWSLPLAAGSTPGNYNLQLFLQRKSDGGYETISPKNADYSPVVFALFPDTDNTGSFTLVLPPDTYEAGQGILFAAGSNFTDPNPITFAASVNVTVTTTNLRVIAPILEADPVVADANGIAILTGGKITVPYRIKYPADKALWDVSTLLYGGFISQVKGDITEGNGFEQFWVTTDKFTEVTVDGDTYMLYSGVMSLTPTAASGVKDLQFGLFNQDFSKEFKWVYPGDFFAVGDWIEKADPVAYPSISAAFAKPAGYPALGGNFGNAIASQPSAANDSKDYFLLLGGLGLKFLRINYSADKYLAGGLYPGQVDQIVQHMLMAGIVPCLAPQDMPVGVGLPAQEAALITLAQQVATRYKGVPVVQDVLNEPHSYTTWAEWKPVAQAVIAAIKAINPSAVIVVGGENYSGSLVAAAADPLPVGSVLAYCCHSYNTSAAQITAALPSTLPAIWVQEYQTDQSDWHTAVAALPNVAALSAWAWTTPGQDMLNLVSSVAGAGLTLTTTGQAIETIYQDWITGKALPVPVVISPPPPPPPPASAPGLTLADVDAEIVKQTAALQTEVTAEQTSIAAAQTSITAEQSSIAELQSQVKALSTPVSPPPPPLPLPPANGLVLDYFNGQNLEPPVVASVIVEDVNFVWESNTSPAAGVNNQYWSARLSARITAPATGLYTFTANMDDGARLFLNGVKILEDWGQGAARDCTGTAYLTAGESAALVLEYFQATGPASLNLSWTPPGQAKTLVPASAFSQV